MVNVTIHVDNKIKDIVAEMQRRIPAALKQSIENEARYIAARAISAGQVVTGGDLVDGSISVRGKQYWVGRNQVDDRGYRFEFNDADEEAAPHIRASDRVVTCGREWMRKHAPAQWAAFCAARILNRVDVAIVPNTAFESHPLIDEDDLEFTP